MTASDINGDVMKTESKTEQLTNFITQLNQHDLDVNTEINQDMVNLTDSMPKLANKVHELSLKREERLKATKGRFNLFTTLLKENDETRLHSRYLFHLLDPTATHDCARMFFDLFVETLIENKPLTHDGKEADIVEVLVGLKSDEYLAGRTEQPTVVA